MGLLMTCRDLQHLFIVWLFADESNLCYTLPLSENEIVTERIIMQLNKVSNSCSANILTMNLFKTSYMVIIGNRQSVTTQGNMQIAKSYLIRLMLPPL